MREDQSHQQQDSAKEESARQDNKQGQGEENTEESSCKHENTGIKPYFLKTSVVMLIVYSVDYIIWLTSRE